MCYKELSYTCEPLEIEPIAVYAMLHDFARRAFIMLDPFKPFCAEKLPDLRLRVPRRLIDRLHKDLIEAVWHPDRVRKGLMSIDSDIDRLLNVS